MRALLPLLAPLLLSLAACSATVDRDPSTARSARWCAEEHPIDAGARLLCEDARGVTPPPAAPARAVYVVAAPTTNAGQGLIDYGRQLAARPVRCTSIGMGSFTRTTCR